MELSRSGLGRSSFLMKRQKLLAWRTLVRGRLASKSCFEFVLRNRRKVSCSWSFFGSHLLPQVFDLLRQVGVFHRLCHDTQTYATPTTSDVNLPIDSPPLRRPSVARFTTLVPYVKRQRKFNGLSSRAVPDVASGGGGILLP